MTPAQFDALAQLLRLREGPARDAARMALVDELRPVDIASLLGMTPQAASNAIQRARRGYALACACAGRHP